MGHAKVEAMDYPDTPVLVIKGAMEMFLFACFVADAIEQGRIKPNTFREEIRIDDGGEALAFKKQFVAREIAVHARNNVLMALGSTAIATDKAMDAALGGKNPDDTSSLGSARAIVYQIRCAFAHDPLNPVWTPDPRRYKYTYCITVNVPR